MKMTIVTYIMEPLINAMEFKRSPSMKQRRNRTVDFWLLGISWRTATT